MRLLAMACAAAVVFCVTAFGAIVVLTPPAPVASPTPAESAPTPVAAGQAFAAPEPAAEPRSLAISSPIETTGAGAANVAAASEPQPPVVVAQAAPRAAPAAPAAPPAPATAAPPPPPAPSTASSCPGNPNALGISRVVEIDTTGGPGFGFEHFKSYDFLREGEVVLTFDDGPWPKSTPAVLTALAAHCTKAIFFPIGIHATWHPEILKQVVAAGHAVGSHTWCHQNLSKTKGTCRVNNKTVPVEYTGQDEIEKGISAVRWAAGVPTAPYFRFPALKQPPELIEYLGKRNIAIFSADLDSFDFKMRKPEQVRQSVLTKLKKHGKGIVLLHDFQHATGEAAMALLDDLKANGYKIVFMRPKTTVTTIASYDEMVSKLVGPTGSAPPIAGVIKDVPQ
jgi:peptidoglycan/xylan/chitin deacetylase (PgdA/CDA1 family)